VKIINATKDVPHVMTRIQNQSAAMDVHAHPKHAMMVTSRTNHQHVISSLIGR
jgi:hypothetical protein